jgi:hypothetical protein
MGSDPVCRSFHQFDILINMNFQRARTIYFSIFWGYNGVNDFAWPIIPGQRN